jgi:hypothetical protein
MCGGSAANARGVAAAVDASLNNIFPNLPHLKMISTVTVIRSRF